MHLARQFWTVDPRQHHVVIRRSMTVNLREARASSALLAANTR